MDKLKYIKLENEDGSFSQSIPLAVDAQYVDVNGQPLSGELNSKATKDEISNLSNELNIQKMRIDNLSTLQDGSTTGDAELIDVRVGEFGNNYNNAGAAIRKQFEARTNSLGIEITKAEICNDTAINRYENDYNSITWIETKASAIEPITFRFNVERFTYYTIIMVNGNRNRIALTNDIYNVETKESIKGIQISNESSNYDYKKITVYSGPFEYLYVYTTDNYSKYNLTDAKVYKNLELMEKTQQNGGLYINYTEDQILNKYDYRYYVSGSTIAQATGDTARCGFFELKPNSFYCIPMHKGDRYRVALTNELYTNKTVNNLYWYEGSIVYFYNKDCKYCYVYISNNKKEFDVPIYIGKLSTTYTNIYGGKANSNLNLFDTNIISTTLDYIINVQDYGAKGDGSTDDTEALEEAMKAGYEQNKPVVFPNGEYLIRRPLTLRNNMEIYGLNNAIIKKQKATTTRLSTQLNEGSEVMTVQSVVGFKVGDAITVSKQADTYPAARYCSVGIITAINTSTNQITFKSAYDTIKKGAIQNHPIGCYVTNSCAIFRSWGMLYECKNVYIHNLTLDGQRQEGEFGDWQNGIIHIDATSGSPNGIPYKYEAKENTFRDLIIKNSPFDGISDQSIGGATIENCKISNCYMHGIHFGTTYTDATVLNNYIENCKASGVFWCQDVQNIIVQGNHIVNCNKGCSDQEYGTAAAKSIITGNTFRNITTYVFDFSLSGNVKGNIIVSNNIIEDCKYIVANLPSRTQIMFIGNMITNFTNAPEYLFNLNSSTECIFGLNSANGIETTKIYKDNNTPKIDLGNNWISS